MECILLLVNSRTFKEKDALPISLFSCLPADETPFSSVFRPFITLTLWYFLCFSPAVPSWLKFLKHIKKTSYLKQHSWLNKYVNRNKPVSLDWKFNVGLLVVCMPAYLLEKEWVGQVVLVTKLLIWLLSWSMIIFFQKLESVINSLMT